MKTSPFSPKSLVLFIACAVFLFALSILLSKRDVPSELSETKPASGTYSVSAIGHAGFYDFLKRMGRSVKRGLNSSRIGMIKGNATLIVAEPPWQALRDPDPYKYFNVKRMLLVLPKWTGSQDEIKPAWLKDIYPVPLSLAQQTLALVTSRGEVFRKNWPETWTHNEMGIEPAGAGTIQLIRSSRLVPIIGDESGILLGEYADGGRKVWILSDPDLLSNHGLIKGENAALMLKLVDTLRLWENKDNNAPLVFDETNHDKKKSHGTILNLFLSFPLGMVTLLICLAALLLVWSTAGRFGIPEKMKPELDFGKTKLIDNSARLLDYAGYHGVVFKRYIKMTVNLAAKALHAPKLEEKALALWLDRIGKARGVRESCSEILQDTARLDAANPKNLPGLFENARAIHRWKGEILDEHTADRANS